MTAPDVKALGRELRASTTSEVRRLEIAGLGAHFSRVLAKSGRDPRTLQTLTVSADATTRRGLARNPATPPGALEVLARDRLSSVLVALADHPALPPAALERLARHPCDAVRTVLARHPALSAVLTDGFSRDASPLVRATVARRMAFPAVLARLLASDPEALVRGAVAEHPALSAAQRLTLHTDPDDYVRRCAASHPALSPAQRYANLTDPEAGVRSAALYAETLTHTLRLPLAVYEALARDPEPELRRQLSGALTLLFGLPLSAGGLRIAAVLLRDADPFVRQDVAPLADPADLAAHAGDPQEVVRYQVALRCTDSAALATLCGDIRWVVRHALAGNPCAPLSALERLGTGPDPVIAALARLNAVRRGSSLEQP